MIYWAAVILASLSWVFAFRHYISPDSVQQWAFIGAGLLLGTIGLRKWAGRIGLSYRYWLLLLPLAVALSYSEPAYRPPLLLLGAGIFLLPIATGLKRPVFLAQVGAAALLLGTLLVIQSPTFWWCTAWTARNPEVPGVAALLCSLLSWLGADVGSSGGTLFVRMMRETHVFPPIWDHFALFAFLQIWLAGVFLIWTDRRRRPLGRSVAKLSTILIAYGIFRFALIILVFVSAMAFVKYGDDAVHFQILWMPWIKALSFLPLIPIIARLLSWTPAGLCRDDSSPTPRHASRRAITWGLACAGCAGLAIGTYFFDPGTPKQGRILLDEAHSLWERSDNVYDTDWYGNESGYNYYCIARYLEHFYSLETNREDPLSAERLADVDILILKTPTEAYSDDELDAIEQFVRNGGGLFALGEHTNVFGSSTFLNPPMRRFGLAFEYDAIFDIERKWEQLAFIPEYGSHPIVQHMPFFRFAVSCSLASNSWKTRPAIRSTGLWNLPIDYASGNFYPQVEDSTRPRFGAFDQIVSTTVDQGRVVAFTDSTVYSNFLAFFPGKPELLLSTMQWLNRTNKSQWINTVGYGAFLLSFVMVALLCYWLRPHPGLAASIVVSCAATVWLTMHACSACAKTAYPLPQPHDEIHNIVFEMDHSSYELPVFAFTQNYAESYAIFYQWVLRLGYYTTITFDLDEALQGTEPIVLIRPDKPFSPKTLASAKDYLERGGAIFLLDSPGNAASTSNAFLKQFGMSFSGQACRGSAVVEPESGARICISRSAMAVTGGTQLLNTDSGELIVSYTTVGNGRLIVAGLADGFRDPNMGGSSRTVPNPQTRARYELEFSLLRGLAEGNVAAEIRALGKTYSP